MVLLVIPEAANAALSGAKTVSDPPESAEPSPAFVMA